MAGPAGLSILVLAAAYALMRAGTSGDGAPMLRPGSPDVVAAGRQIYAAQCAGCHGADLEGQPDWQQPGPDGLMPAPPHDETGHTWHHPDRVLFTITKHGVGAAVGRPDHRSAMPAYAGILSDAEIVAALSYIKSRWPAELRARHDALNRAFAEGAGR